MKSRTYIHWIFFLLLCCTFYGCAGNPGIEAGNPDVKGKKVDIFPTDSTTSFAIEFVDDTTAQVSEIKPDGVESVSVPYQITDYVVSLDAGFSDGSTIATAIHVNEQGVVTNVHFTLDGILVPVDFKSQETPSGETSGNSPDESVNPALLLSSHLCEKIVACNADFDQADCELQVDQVDGLSHEFGGLPNQSLEACAAAIDAGDIQVDSAKLEDCSSSIALVDCKALNKDFNDVQTVDFTKVKKIIPKPVCIHVLLSSPQNP